MEYYGCHSIAGLNLGVMGNFAKPLEEQKILYLCCEPRKELPGIPLFKDPEETLERFLGMRQRLIVRGGDLPPSDVPCISCPYYVKKDWGMSFQITNVSFAMSPILCQCNCIYCTQHDGVDFGWDKNPNIIKAYERLFAFLNLAKRENIISPIANYNLASGEFSIHPYKKQFMKFLKGSHFAFYTNAFIFDKEMAQELHENQFTQFSMSLDSGTPETWYKIKGSDNFYKVLENIKKYYASASNKEQFFLKYIVLPGINDSEEDFRGFVEFKKNNNIAGVTGISRDNRVFLNVDPNNGQISEQIISPEIIEPTARLVAIHAKEIGPVAFSNFTLKEKQLILELAEKILQYM